MSPISDSDGSDLKNPANADSSPSTPTKARPSSVDRGRRAEKDAEESRLAPVSKTETLLALAPSSIIMIPGRGPVGMKTLGDLVASVPCYRLELGRNLDSIADRVRDICGEVA